MPIVKCKFTCHSCGLYRVDFDVDAPEDDEVPAAWLERALNPALVSAHTTRSPTCRPRTIDEVLIPYDKDGKISNPVA